MPAPLAARLWQELLNAPGWAAGATDARQFHWAKKHNAMARAWVGCWPDLLAAASKAGLQQQARALLATAGAAMLSAEAAALGGLAEPRVGDFPADDPRWVVWRYARAEGLALMHQLSAFLLAPDGRPVSASRAWLVARTLASAAPYVLRLCSRLCSGQLPTGPKIATKFANQLNVWCKTCIAAAQAARARVQQQQLLPPEQQRERAGAAAALARSLLHLTRLAPQLQSSMHGCTGEPGCTCPFCPAGGPAEAAVLVMHDLLHALHAAVDLAG